MPKQLNEAAAWRKMAEWVEKHPSESEHGLCSLLWWKVESPGVSAVQTMPAECPYSLMYERIKGHTDDDDNTMTGAYLHRCYDDDCNVTHTPHARVIFCLLMALEAEEEGK